MPKTHPPLPVGALIGLQPITELDKLGADFARLVRDAGSIILDKSSTRQVTMRECLPNTFGQLILLNNRLTEIRRQIHHAII